MNAEVRSCCPVSLLSVAPFQACLPLWPTCLRMCETTQWMLWKNPPLQIAQLVLWSARSSPLTVAVGANLCCVSVVKKCMCCVSVVDMFVLCECC